MSSDYRPDDEPPPLAESYQPDQILVEEKHERAVWTALKKLGCEPEPAESVGKHGLLRIRLGSAGPADELYEYLQERNSPALGNYGHNRHHGIGTLAPASNDPVTAQGSDPKIWGSDPVHATGAFEGGRSLQSVAHRKPTRSGDAGAGVVVGVLDTKISGHDYLNGGFVAMPDSIHHIAPEGTLADEAGHATFVAGLILQQAPAATVHVRGVLSDAGVCDSITLHDAMIDMAEEPIDILNLSLGCNTADDRPPFAIRRALERFQAKRPGAIVVAAAGNHPSSRQFWPAALPSVLAVTSATALPESTLWDEAPGYPSEPWVDVAAPGLGVVSTFFTGNYRNPQREVESYDGWAAGSGTSFACAIASGYLARIWFPGCRTFDLLSIARRAATPSTRTGGRLVLGIEHALRESAAGRPPIWSGQAPAEGTRQGQDKTAPEESQSGQDGDARGAA